MPALAAAVLAVASCQSAPKRPAPAGRVPTESVLRITQHVGGTHRDMLVHEDRWFQCFSSELLTLDPRSMRVLHSLELGRIGEAGPAVDMIRDEDSLLVVLEDDAVVRIAIEENAPPRILEQHSAADLGIRPRRVSEADDDIFISGVGGVVRLRDGAIVRQHDGEAGPVAMSEQGPVVCIGRRVYRLGDGGYAGSAGELIPVSVADNSDAAFVFVRQFTEGALVGLMSGDLRELDADHLTIAVPGVVRRVRFFDADGSIRVVTDDEILTLRVEDGRLQRGDPLDVLAARDVAALDENHLAVAGSFGRAIYRIRATDRGSGDTFRFTHREPSGLSRAETDGRYLLAGGREGSWLYLPGSRVEISENPVSEDAPPPSQRAETGGFRAAIDEDRLMLRITGEDGELEHREPHGRSLHCVLAINERFWVAHDAGITVLSITPQQRRGPARLSIDGRVRLDGPVRYLFPLNVGDGAVYVAEYGGFGIARWVEEPLSGERNRR